MKTLEWKEILYDEIAKSSIIQFKWGENDCVKWSIGILRKITTNPLPFGAEWQNPPARSSRSPGKKIP